MITSVFFGFRQRSEVMVIPVATLFAFTQLRQSMPGAPPGFGMFSHHNGDYEAINATNFFFDTGDIVGMFLFPLSKES